jgi:hypothetical protein
MPHVLRVPTGEFRYPITLRILVKACDGLRRTRIAQEIHMD